MRTCYIDKATRSIAELVVLDEENAMLLTRINVPEAHRGQGHARALLARVLADADKEQVKLYLEIHPSDGLTYRQLEAWYRRRGFRNVGDIFRRRPLQS